VFTSSGGYITQWGSEGTGPGQFEYPCDVAVDASGNVYVADEMNSRIQVFCYGQTAVQNTTWGRVKSMFR
jgi:DNA-binding beta-propeller fold protein YncE